MSGTGGWYPDPQDSSRARWWDGEWTDHVRDTGPAALPAPVATLAPPAPAAPEAPPAALTLTAPALDAPPEPAPTPDAAPDDAPPSKTGKASKAARSGRSPITVAIVILTIGLLALGGLWVAGVITPTKDEGTAVPAADTSPSTFQGPGYTMEVPADWSQQSGALATNVDAAFTVPTPATVTVGSVEGDANELADATARQAAFDSMLRVQLSVYPDVSVVSQEAATLDGAPGERITLEGPGPSGATVRVVELVAVHDGRIVFLGIEGAPDAVDAATLAFDAAVSSFSFD
jgi:hypothetical protein